MSVAVTRTNKRPERPTLSPEKGSELLGMALVGLSLLLALSFASYQPSDPSLFHELPEAARSRNWIGPLGAQAAAVGFGFFGVSCFLTPIFLLVAGWRRLRSAAAPRVVGRGFGSALLLASMPALCQVVLGQIPWRGEAQAAGGAIGSVVVGLLDERLNVAGSLVVLALAAALGLALVVQSTLGQVLASWRQRLRQVWQDHTLARERRKERREKERARRRVITKHLQRVVEEKQQKQRRDEDVAARRAPDPSQSPRSPRLAVRGAPMQPLDALNPMIAAGDPGADDVSTMTDGRLDLPLRAAPRQGPADLGVRRVVSRPAAAAFLLDGGAPGAGGNLAPPRGSAPGFAPARGAAPAAAAAGGASAAGAAATFGSAGAAATFGSAGAADAFGATGAFGAAGSSAAAGTAAASGAGGAVGAAGVSGPQPVRVVVRRGTPPGHVSSTGHAPASGQAFTGQTSPAGQASTGSASSAAAASAGSFADEWLDRHDGAGRPQGAEPLRPSRPGTAAPASAAGPAAGGGSSAGAGALPRASDRAAAAGVGVPAAALPQPKLPFAGEANAVPGGGVLPPINLLQLGDGKGTMDETELMRLGEVIRNRCAEFGVEGTIEAISPGPVITVYEFQPAPGVKVAHIVNLQDDLALALKAESVRIDRLAGRSTLGLEVPNRERGVIRLGSLLADERFRKLQSPLTMAIGTTIYGEPYYADLATMPHLLVAGATGAGKSVGLQSMITSILYRATRDEVQFIFIDPKRIELGVYADIPHLKAEVVVDPKKAANALRWAVAEMERRYRLLAEVHVRSIAYYNRAICDPEVRERLALTEDAESSPFTAADLKPMPYYVVIIDELADLMMVSSSEVETSIARLAQMARAVGIHLIVATQRPSVDVLTGTIKANFPCRISYATASRHDSRTILDQVGSEKLLGKGDMLMMPPGSSRVIRLHGAYVSEQETASLVRWLKKQGKPDLDPDVLRAPAESEGHSGEAGDNDDELYDEAARLVVAERQASASFLQRRMRIGFSRAARLIDLMERDGLLGPPQGSKPREVLVKPDYFNEMEIEQGYAGDDDN